MAQTQKGGKHRRYSREEIIRNRMIFAVLVVALLAVMINIVSGALKSSQKKKAEKEAERLAALEPAPTPKPYPVDLGDWRMILVNADNPAPDGYAVEAQTADSYTGKQLQTEAAQQYQAMKMAAAQDGVDLMLCSAYRDTEYQTVLFEKEKQEWLAKGYSEEDAFNQAATVVAIPGRSEHCTGLAADIVTPAYQDLSEGFEQTEAFAWLSEHAREYGFVLRYPRGKEAITGISYEPWHYRYVGVENAGYIWESGLCLEEFIELMRD